MRLGLHSGGIVLLDPHDYARYFGKVIGSPEVTQADFADFWKRLAGRFKSSPQIWFGLMNEPHDLPDDQWLGAANAAIAAIRKTGSTNLILVPGNAWTGAHSWAGSGNDKTMLRVVDPADHYLFEVHQYLDKDSSGTSTQVVSPTIGSQRLREFTAWCRKHRKRAFLGEFGAAVSPAGQAAVADMISYMEANADVWVGFTWWAAGPWWGDYMYSIEPKNGHDRPQMDWLLPHLQAAPRSRGSRRAHESGTRLRPHPGRKIAASRTTTAPSHNEQDDTGEDRSMIRSWQRVVDPALVWSV